MDWKHREKTQTAVHVHGISYNRFLHSVNTCPPQICFPLQHRTSGVFLEAAGVLTVYCTSVSPLDPAKAVPPGHMGIDQGLR